MHEAIKPNTLGIVAALAVLAGCGGLQPAAPPVAIPHAAARGDQARSWMAPGAKKLDLLYVSDYATNDVYAYSYPQGTLSGVLRAVLARFVLPTGLCADGTGDVFIPDSSNSTVLEYAHGSTKLVRTLRDPKALPYSCAVDPASGNLAVMNLESFAGAGDVAIYTRARGRPKKYAYGFVYKYYFGAYDDRGNLFVSASDDLPSEPFAFLELPKDARALRAVTLDQNVGVPGGVGWDGKHVAVGDSSASAIYRFTMRGSAGTKAGTTRLRRARALAQFFIAGAHVVGANFRGANVSFWKYPAGGAPSETIVGLREPFGVTLSLAAKQP